MRWVWFGGAAVAWASTPLGFVWRAPSGAGPRGEVSTPAAELWWGAAGWLAGYLAIAGVIAVWLRWAERPRETERWLAKAGVELSDAAVEDLRCRRSRARLHRATGAIAALAGNGWAAWLFERPLLPTYLAIFGGYLLAALLSDLSTPRSGPPGRARLSARRVEDYLDPVAASAAKVLAGLVVLAFIGYLAMRLGGVVDTGAWSSERVATPWAGFGGTDPSMLFVYGPIGVVVLPLAVVGAWVTSRATQRAIAERSQPPMMSREQLIVDDLMRSSSVHAISGATIAIELALLGASLEVLSYAGLQPEGFWANLGESMVFPLALGIWLGYGTRFTYRPDRIDRHAEVTA